MRSDDSGGPGRVRVGGLCDTPRISSMDVEDTVWVGVEAKGRVG
jgi:hypothetical protein